ncbi:MAG TPA: trigger factor [Limnochordales bacterium]
MNTRVERLPGHPSRVVLEVEVEPERVERAVDSVYRRLARQVRIPGFRPGKAPRPVVEMHLGKDALYLEAVDELIPQAYREAVRQTSLEPVAQAKIDIIDYGAGKPLKFKAEVDVKPEVKLGQYRGLAVEKRIRKVTEKDVDRVIDALREQFAELVKAEKERLEPGDYAVVDFEGLIDGKPFRGGAAKGEIIRVGADGVLPAFSEQLVGMAPGEDREFELTFPPEAREDLAGKTAKFRVHLHEIKQRRVPEADDEFAKDVGEFETIADLRADRRRRLEEAEERAAEVAMRDALMEQAVANSEVELPPVMVDQELNRLRDEFVLNLWQNGLTLERYLELTQQTEADLEERLRPSAAQRVKAELVLEAIAKAEGLEPTEEEIDARLQELFASVQDTKEREERIRNEDNRLAVRDSLRRAKAMDFLVQHAQVTVTEYEPAAETAQAGDATETGGAAGGADGAPAAEATEAATAATAAPVAASGQAEGEARRAGAEDSGQAKQESAPRPE